eukprot:5776021-Prymnesium_polylepis.1
MIENYLAFESGLGVKIGSTTPTLTHDRSVEVNTTTCPSAVSLPTTDTTSATGFKTVCGVRVSETPIGNLIADALRQYANTDFADSPQA